MIDPLAIPNYERDFQLFPTRDNLHKIFAVFTHYLGRVCRGAFDKDPADKERYRLFCMDMATRILCWFENFKQHFISGFWMFVHVPEKLRSEVILHVNEGKPFNVETLEFFEKICGNFTGEFSYWIEINSQDRLQDGPLSEGVHLFGGMKVDGLQGGIAHHVMKKIYAVGGPTKALQKKLVLNSTYEAIGMPLPKGANRDGFDPHKARSKLVWNIGKIEAVTNVQFPVKLSVKGASLVVTARSNRKKTSGTNKSSKDQPGVALNKTAQSANKKGKQNQKKSN